MNCHAVGGTPANGRFGPDLTHLMSRATIASGAANKYTRKPPPLDSEPKRDQARLTDAGHAVERCGPGCSRELYGDTSLEEVEGQYVIECDHDSRRAD